MKSIILFFSFLLPGALIAQELQGLVIYKETEKLEIDIPEEHREQLKSILPDSRTSKKVLLFNSTESIYKDHDENEDEIIEAGSEQGGMHMKMHIQRPDNQLYKNLAQNEIFEKQEFFGRDFLIVDDAREITWKISNEQKEILGYTCQKASSESGDQDVIAWFTPQIPLSNGPQHFGQLPGLILELTVGGDETFIIAEEIMLGDAGEDIKAPKKGKKVSREEFKKIVEEKQKEMEDEYGNSKGRMIIKTERR